eukprot:282838-Prorocentrum_minimum.AAC.1
MAGGGTQSADVKVCKGSLEENVRAPVRLETGAVKYTGSCTSAGWSESRGSIRRPAGDGERGQRGGGGGDPLRHPGGGDTFGHAAHLLRAQLRGPEPHARAHGGGAEETPKGPNSEFPKKNKGPGEYSNSTVQQQYTTSDD